MAIDAQAASAEPAYSGGSDEELLDLVDADNTVIGTVARSRVHGEPALRHRAVHVLVYDDRGRLLLQKRSSAKQIQPGKWDTSVGGHLAAGESYLAGAVREAAEELGLAIDAAALAPVNEYVWRSAVETEHVASYRIQCGGPFRPHPEEVDEVRFWSAQELRAGVGAGGADADAGARAGAARRNRRRRRLRARSSLPRPRRGRRGARRAAAARRHEPGDALAA